MPLGVITARPDLPTMTIILILFQMPRKYRRKTTRGSWTEQTLKAALNDIENGRSLRQVSIAFGIPRSTLQDHRRAGNFSKLSLGRKPVFSKDEENELLLQVIKLGQLFYGITPLEIKKCAYAYAHKNNLKHPFTNEAAGRDWLEGFIKRNPRISLRKPEAISVNRIQAFNKQEVTLFYDNLNKLMDRYKFLQSRIFNADETGITTVQRPGKIYAERGQKRVGYVTSAERGKTTTVLCAFSASGMYIPPLFIFARKRMAPHLKKNGPPGAIYLCSDNGWITENIFLEWLKHFKKFVNASSEDPVLLAIDNHATHCTLPVYNYCRDNGIIILTIPPHTSHRIQPLDVSFYAPLKTAYNNECDKYLRSHVGERITTNEIAEIFNKAFGRVATPERAIKGFEATGIFPINRDIFTDDDFSPAENFIANRENPDVTDIGLNEKQDAHSNAHITNIENQQENLEVNEVIQNELHRNITNETATRSTIQKTPEKEQKTSFIEILSIASTSNPKPKEKRKVREKQHSEIFTSTPMKDVLEEKENKKQQRLDTNKRKQENIQRIKRNVVGDDGLMKEMTLNPKVSLPKLREKSISHNKKPKYNEEDELNNLENSEDDNDDNITEDVCTICGEFGKNGELWIRCTICSGWAHKECTGANNLNWICDFCE